MADLTILNPQPFIATVAIDMGNGLETRNLGFNETWTVPAPEREAWIAFFLLESGELLAQGELAAGATTAQLLLEQPYEIVLRMSPDEPLEIVNGLDIGIRVDVLPVGSAEVLSRDLDPAGEDGSTWTLDNFKNGQWIGFYSEDDEYIGASLDGSSDISQITLMEPGAVYVIGDPYPAGAAEAAGTPVVSRSFLREKA
jgi:hypothetical protein